MPNIANITPSHHVLCAGRSIVLTADEAARYLWSTGETTQFIMVSAPGTYTLTVWDDEFDCPSITSFELEQVEVTIKPEIEVVAGRLALCPGATVTLRASEGVAFLWSNDATTQEITVAYADAGHYSVTAFDVSGCAVVTESVEVVAVEEIIPVIDVGIGAICGNEPHILSVSPIDPSYTYEWSNGAASHSIEILTPGNYWVAITNEGCRFQSSTVTIRQVAAPEKPVISANFPIINNNISACPNQVNSGIFLESTEPYHAYFWNTGEETRRINISEVGEYILTVANAAGCMAVSDAVTIDMSTTLVNLETENDIRRLCPNGSVLITVNGAEDGSTFIWYISRDFSSTYELLPGVTTSSYVTSEVGAYYVEVSTTGGCVENTPSIEILAHPTFPPSIITYEDLSICSYDSVRLISSQGVIYQWRLINETGGIELIGNTQAIYAKKPGTYIVSVTDRFGCVQEAVEVVEVFTPRTPIIRTQDDRSVICQGETLDIWVDAPAGSTFIWSTGETTQTITYDSPNRFGTQSYWVEVTYPEGCVFRSPVRTIQINMTPRRPEITVIGSNRICPDFTVALIATSSDLFTYQWHWETSPGVWENYPGGQTYGIVVDENANYSVTITDRNGCSNSEIIELTSLSSATAEIYPSGTLSLCEEGFVVLTALADNVRYVWNTGETTKSIVVTQEGFYRVTIFEVLENGATCEVTSDRVEVRNAPLIPPARISASGPTNICIGSSVTLTSTPSPNGRYQWIRLVEGEPVAVGDWNQLVVSESGSYAMIFIDANGCVIYSNFINVTVFPSPEATITPANPFTICQGNSIALTANAGSGTGYLYLWERELPTGVWTSAGTTRTINASIAGRYRVRVTSPNGCFTTSDPTLVQVSTERAPMPSVNNATVASGRAVRLTATSTLEFPEFLWWDAPTGGNLIWGGSTLQTPELFDEYKVWVSVQSETDCESERREVTVTIMSEDATETGPVYRIPNE
jgi:hypothetical protein